MPDRQQKRVRRHGGDLLDLQIHFPSLKPCFCHLIINIWHICFQRSPHALSHSLLIALLVISTLKIKKHISENVSNFSKVIHLVKEGIRT